MLSEEQLTLADVYKSSSSVAKEPSLLLFYLSFTCVSHWIVAMQGQRFEDFIRENLQ